jgi:hypothetical protein
MEKADALAIRVAMMASFMMLCIIFRITCGVYGVLEYGNDAINRNEFLPSSNDRSQRHGILSIPSITFIPNMLYLKEVSLRRIPWRLNRPFAAKDTPSTIAVRDVMIS